MQKPIPATKKDVTFVPVLEKMTDIQILERAAKIRRKSIDSMTEEQILERAEQIMTRRRESEHRQKEVNRLALEQEIERQKEVDKKKKEARELQERRDNFLENHTMSMLRLIRHIWSKTDDENMAEDVSRRLRLMLEHIQTLQLNSHDYVLPSVKYETKYSKLFEDLQKKQKQVELYLQEKKWFSYKNYFPEDKDIHTFGESHYAFYKYGISFCMYKYCDSDSDSNDSVSDGPIY